MIKLKGGDYDVNLTINGKTTFHIISFVKKYKLNTCTIYS